MDNDKYETLSDEGGKLFTFISLGKIEIIKIIRYDTVDTIYQGTNGTMYQAYNLGFGDKRTDSLKINDLARSNNGDMLKVFNTVLYTIPVFFNKVKNAAIHIRGADKTRHLAYHRFLNRKIEEFEVHYLLYGSQEGILHPFIKGTIYEYIVVLPKKY